MSVPYQLAVETFDGTEIEAAKAVLDSGRLTMGENVRAFEREFADWVGAKHAMMVNSGSSANLLMVDAMLRRSDRPGVFKPGDEVLVPALAWPTTVWPLCQLGLVPVFVDVDPATLAIDVESAKTVLSPKTRGVFVIHALGQAADVSALRTFCDAHGLALLEDTCESLGAHFEGRHVGTFGVMGSFSSYFSHHITTIEGGFIVCSDDALHDDLLSLRAHGWIRDRSDRDKWIARHPELDPRFLFATGGYNVRPMEIQAAIGRVQLRKLDDMLRARDDLAAAFHRTVSKVPWLELIGARHVAGKPLPIARRDRTGSWMTFPLRLRADAPLDTAAVKARLEAQGVETRPVIAGNLARHPALAQFTSRSAASLPVCDSLLEKAFMIGCHPKPKPGSVETLMNAFESLARA